MPDVTYLKGDTTQYGYTFRDGKSVEVTDEAHLSKFRGNRYFEVEDTQESDGGLSAKHVGRGAYYIMRGEERVGEKMSKEDADTFNALSDDKKAAFVEGLG